MARFPRGDGIVDGYLIIAQQLGALSREVNRQASRIRGHGREDRVIAVNVVGLLVVWLRREVLVGPGRVGVGVGDLRWWFDNWLAGGYARKWRQFGTADEKERNESEKGGEFREHITVQAMSCRRFTQVEMEFKSQLYHI